MTWEESTKLQNEFVKRRLSQPKPRKPKRERSEWLDLLSRVQTRYKVAFLLILLLLAGGVTVLGTRSTEPQPPAAAQAQPRGVDKGSTPG